MHFTYDSYRHLIDFIKECGYTFCGFHDYLSFSRCVIMRHDVDNSLENAVVLAEIERSKSVKSTFFVLLNTDFYNVASKRSLKMIDSIINAGHEIGLHFDETAYGCDELELKHFISREAKILSEIIDYPVTSFSMHRPNKRVLNSDLKVPGLINAYGHPFFDDFKYLSDSRMEWREPVLQIIEQGNYDRLQILTHAFWYQQSENEIGTVIKKYIESAKEERYNMMAANIKNIESLYNL